MKRISLITLTLATILSAKEIPANDPEIRISGRVDYSLPSVVGFDWPGTVITARFTGTSFDVFFGGEESSYNLIVDGGKPETINPYLQTLVATKTVSGLSEGEHTIRLEKRYESFSAYSTIRGFGIDDTAHILPLPPRPSQKIEFIGDSYSVGYGVESPSREDGKNAYENFTNISKAYTVLTANHFGAEPIICAGSGKGLVQNMGRSEPGFTIPYLYEWTLRSAVMLSRATPKWDFSKFVPNLVVINLGTNDFNADVPDSVVDSASFVKGYHAFLKKIRLHYPKTNFILCASSMWPDNKLIPAVKAVVTEEQAAGQTDVFYYDFTRKNSDGWSGLNWHPNEIEQQGIADGLIALIEKNNLLSKITAIVPEEQTSSLVSVQQINQSLKISFPTSQETVSLNCYSLGGRKITKLYEGSVQAGEFQVSLRDLVPGTYIVTLNYGETECSSKVVVQ